MLSILIPVYNTDINELVKSLITSAEVATLRYQIIVVDDGSEEHFQNANQKVAELFHVSYITLTENIGRAKIRNKLAQLAAYPWLLFLDCDSLLEDEKGFLKNYFEHIDKLGIVSGGRIYAKNDNPNFALHYNYGNKIESKSASQRSKSPFESFHSNNFLIHIDDFNKLKFSEEISGYGYEDVEFAQRAKEQSIQIIHIDNPVIHNILDNNKNFLLKTQCAITNLYKLHENNSLTTTKLIRTYHLVKPIIHLIPQKNRLKNILFHQLQSGKYSTFKFQLLKLLWFHDLSVESKNPK
jgi:GT2 family glycosyltransferase